MFTVNVEIKCYWKFRKISITRRGAGYVIFDNLVLLTVFHVIFPDDTLHILIFSEIIWMNGY